MLPLAPTLIEEQSEVNCLIRAARDYCMRLLACFLLDSDCISNPATARPLLENPPACGASSESLLFAICGYSAVSNVAPARQHFCRDTDPAGCERIKTRIEQLRPRLMFESGASTDLPFGGTRAAICAPTGNTPNILKLTTTPEGAVKVRVLSHASR